jgi:hypothetical protein
MNCEEVQKYLSDFLDESLEVERSQKVSDHLGACSLCSEETASLAECQRFVSGLPAVEPPVGFTTRVMAQVREAARKPNLWERLFSSLRINIPLQATAVVLIAVLAAYIYQKQPGQRESGVTLPPESSFEDQEETDKLAPSTKRAPSIASKTKEAGDETKARIQEFKDSAQLKKPQPPSKPEEQHQPANSSPAPLQEKPPAASEAASHRLEQSSPSGEARPKASPPPVPQSGKESASKDAAFARKSSALVERSARPSLNPLSSGTVIGVTLPADHELAIRLRELVRDDKNTEDRLAWGRAQAERRLSTLQEEAKNLEQAREQVIRTGQSQTVWVNIARNQYERFKKELAELGNIEVESSRPDSQNDPVSKSSDRLRIKVTILPPPSSGNPVPSAASTP